MSTGDLEAVAFAPPVRSAVTSEPVPTLEIAESNYSHEQKTKLRKALAILAEIGGTPLENVIEHLETELGSCGICTEYINDLIVLDCNHHVCRVCVQMIRNCPYCRRPISLAFRASHNASSSSGDPNFITLTVVFYTRQKTVSVNKNLTVAGMRNFIAMHFNLPSKDHKKVIMRHEHWEPVALTAHPNKIVRNCNLSDGDHIQCSLPEGLPGGMPVRKTILKDSSKDKSQNAKKGKLETLKEDLKASVAKVTEIQAIPEVQTVSVAMADFLKELESNGAIPALTTHIKKMSLVELAQFQKSLVECNSSNAEQKVQRVGHEFFGVNMGMIYKMMVQCNAVVESAQALTHYAFLKATEQDRSFSLRAVNTLIDKEVAFKEGQMAGSSSSTSVPALSADDLSNAFNKMSM